MDIAVHAWTYLTLQENSDVLVRFFGSGANMFRSGAIYNGVMAGVSSTPTALNLVDMGLHFLNAMVPIVTDYDDDKVETKTAKMN